MKYRFPAALCIFWWTFMVSEIFIVNLPLCPMYFSAKIRGFVFSLCIFMNGIVYKL